MSRGIGIRAASAIAATGLAVLLAGCSSAPPKPKPTPLAALTPSLAVQPAWTQRLGRVRLPLRVAVGDGSFTVADDAGTVAAYAAADGRSLWRVEVGAKLSAGVGSDGRRAAVVTGDNELLLIDGGRVAWRARLQSRVTTAPLVAGERVFVMGVDRVVVAFDALDGRPLWRLQRPGDALTLSEAGVVAAFQDTLVVGQGARLAGLDPLKGDVRWEVPVATPRGTNEVERLADLIGPPARVGARFCMRAFQSAVGCVDADRGGLAWTRNVGGTDPVAANEQLVVGADATDRITAWRTASGDVAWGSERLLYRELSAPALYDGAVVFGDLEGQVHFLSVADGALLARMPTDGSPIAAPPVQAEGTLLVVTRDGGLFAFRRP